MSESEAARRGVAPLASIVDYSVSALDPTIMGLGPVEAVHKLLKKNDLTLDDIDLIELNEAFAPQVLACLKGLG